MRSLRSREQWLQTIENSKWIFSVQDLFNVCFRKKSDVTKKFVVSFYVTENDNCCNFNKTFSIFILDLIRFFSSAFDHMTRHRKLQGLMKDIKKRKDENYINYSLEGYVNREKGWTFLIKPDLISVQLTPHLFFMVTVCISSHFLGCLCPYNGLQKNMILYYFKGAKGDFGF